MKRIVVGISGASGMPLAIHLLKVLRTNPDVETHLVISTGAQMTILQETNMAIADVLALADYVYDNHNVAASIASGTFETAGMIVVPCSMKTVAGIAHGYSDNLLLRSCDVTIKEQRQLILVTRESPLSPIHLENLTCLSRLHHVMIMPPMLTYYNLPQTIEDMEIHMIGKILSQFGIEVDQFKRWQ